MAEHNKVAYTTADGNDYPAHEQTYEGFIKLVKYGTAAVVFIVATMAISRPDRGFQATPASGIPVGATTTLNFVFFVTLLSSSPSILSAQNCINLTRSSRQS